MSVNIKIRTRLSSVGDSAPPSESSDGSASETFEQGAIDWHQTNQTHQIMATDSLYTGSTDSDMHSLSPDNGGSLSDIERAQVESFFSGLGTDVSIKIPFLFFFRYF